MQRYRMGYGFGQHDHTLLTPTKEVAIRDYLYFIRTFVNASATEDDIECTEVVGFDQPQCC